MKKILSLILVLVMCISLCACASNSSAEKDGEKGNVDVAKEIIGKWTSINEDVAATWTFIFYEDGACHMESNFNYGYRDYHISGDEIVVDDLDTWDFGYEIVNGSFVLVAGDFIFKKDTYFDATTHTMEQNEILAAQMMIAAVKHFPVPSSVKIKNAWAEEDTFMKDIKFTFELEMLDKYGMAVTGYYGTKISISQATEEFVVADIQRNGIYSNYFCNNQTEAKEKGKELYVTDIQKYFSENYR